MISLETKTDTTSSSPLTLSSSDSDKESAQSFSQLLKGVVDKDGKNIKNDAIVLALGGKTKGGKSDLKGIQNGAIVLALGSKEVKVELKSSSKEESLLSLLKNSDQLENDSKSLLELNPKLTQQLSQKDIKVLVKDAKEYLKNQILNSDGYKKAKIEELPKTLKGLASLAKTIGIDISKITIEKVQTSKVETSELKSTLLSKDTTETKDLTQPKELSATNLKTDKKIDKKSVNTKEQTIIQDKNQSVQKNTLVEKSTPLFKAQTTTEHTTEQIVQVKQLKIETKTPKERADSTLSKLLSSDKPVLTKAIQSDDFSLVSQKTTTISTAAPTAVTEAAKSLEKLLHGDSSQEQKNSSSSNSKVEMITTHKSDSFELKLNEAKQMVKYISQDVKTAIEDYKSPFTRIKVQLNPKNLGTVDLTVVQRGKNLHVNISSNNAAINTLSLNVNELRTQLNTNGINNATLNFNNTSQDSDTNTNQQQNRQNEQKAQKEYNYFEEDEQSEEILSSLEIVVPNYA